MGEIRYLCLEGTPASIGAQHGETLREEIRYLCEERIDLIRSSTPGIKREDVRVAAAMVAREIARQLPRVFEETTSTARAANIDYWELVVAGGYSDVEDVVTRSAAGLGPSRSDCTLLPCIVDDGHILLAGTWDSHATAERSLVLVERRVDAGPHTLALSTAGWPMQQGVTSAGIGFAIANLVARTPHTGVSYIAVLPALAAAVTLEEVVDRLTSVSSCSARFYALCDEHGRYAGVETDGRQFWTSGVPAVHTNHFLSAAGRGVEGRDTSASEARRQKAMEELDMSSIHDAASLFEVLEVNDGTDTSISRRGEGRADRSCAGFVLDPGGRSLLVTAGPPGLSEPREYRLESVRGPAE